MKKLIDLMRGNLMNDFYCVFEYGSAIYGVGKTKESAIKNAKEYLSNDSYIPDFCGYNMTYGNVYVIRCSKRLYDKVIINGGIIGYDIYCNTLYTLEELDAMDEWID